MNVTDAAKYQPVANTQPTTTASTDAETQTTQQPAPESTTVTLSDEALRLSAMSVDDPGGWPKPPKNN